MHNAICVYKLKKEAGKVTAEKALDFEQVRQCLDYLHYFHHRNNPVVLELNSSIVIYPSPVS